MLWLACTSLLLVALFPHVATPANLTVRTIIEPPELTDGLLRDRTALLALRSSIFVYGRSGIKSGWSTSPSSNPCFPVWVRLECRDNRVVSINMANMGIRGRDLPAALATMDKLETLDLSSNDITGSLPGAWGRRLAFMSLQTLNLGFCSLTGQLPSWQSRRAFPALRTLILGGNNFEGTLPESWASQDYRPLRRVVTLDLSYNYLGWNKSGDGAFLPLPDGVGSWGASAETSNPFPNLQSLDLSENFFTGLLPNWGNQYAYPSLRTLDLRYNRLSGALPVTWGQRGAFGRLKSLLLSGNDLGDESSPGGLPTSWTRWTAPRAFPSLLSMALFPGNPNLCTWLDGRPQNDAGYTVVDDTQEVYGPSNWVTCPEPSGDNLPAGVQLSKVFGLSQLQMSWSSTVPYPGFCCGFRTTIVEVNGGTSTTVHSADYQVRPSLGDGITQGAGTYSATTADLTLISGAVYTLSVSTLTCDKLASTAVTGSYTHP